jgi:hypothetical protein
MSAAGWAPLRRFARIRAEKGILGLHPTEFSDVQAISEPGV